MYLDMNSFMDMADGVRKDVVFCILGEPGIGKTRQIQAWADANGRKMVEIIASQILPNEVSGITMPVTETHGMEIFDHVRLSGLKDGDILFFDELLAAAPTTLSACLTLIEDRRLMSGRKLPDVIIVAAANPVANVKSIPLAVRQRFQFIDMTWDHSGWLKYIRQKFGIDGTDCVNDIRRSIDDGSSYNVLTPRSCTKMIELYSTSDDKKLAMNVIASMYNDRLANNIRLAFQSRLDDEIIESISTDDIKTMVLTVINETLNRCVNDNTIGQEEFDELSKEIWKFNDCTINVIMSWIRDDRRHYIFKHQVQNELKEAEYVST